MIPRKRFRRPPEPAPTPEFRSISPDGRGDFAGIFAPTSTTGIPVNKRTALSLAAFYQGVQILSSKVASVDFFVAAMEGGRATRPAPDHPNNYLIGAKPNDWTTNYQMKATAIVNVLTEGDSYWEIVRSGSKRKPIAIEPMDSPGVVAEWDEGDHLVYRLPSGRKIAAADMIHLRALSSDGVCGLAPLRLFAETFGLALAARQHQSSTYANGCEMGGYIEVPGNLKETSRNQILADIEHRHQGVWKSRKLGLLEGGARFNPTTMSPVDAEVIASRNMDVAEVARILNIPPHMLGSVAHAGAASIEDQQIQFYQQTLYPYIKQIEEELRAKLFGPNEYYNFTIAHDPRSLIRGNMAATQAANESQFRMAAKTPNEIRLAAGDPPMAGPEYDKTYLEVNNYAPLGQALVPPGGPAPASESAPAPAPVAPAPEARDADPITILIPETREADPPAPAIPPDVLADLLADPIGRMIRKECRAIRRAAADERFDLRAEEFYASHRDLLAEAVAPGLRVVAAAVGRAIDPAEVAAALADGSLAELRGLWTTHAPDEMPAAVERACLAWEATRADEAIAALVPELRNCGIGPHGFSAGNHCARGGGGDKLSGGKGVPTVSHDDMAARVAAAPGKVAEREADLAVKEADARAYLKEKKGIDRTFPRRDATPPDYRYEHGAPKSEADREHLKEATKAGAVAIHVKTTPQESVVPGGGLPGSPVGGVAGAIGRERPGSKHRLVAGQPAATIYPTNPDGHDDKHTLVLHFDYGDKTTHEVSRHKSADGAERAAARHARAIVRDQTEHKRQVVRRPDQYDPAEHGHAGKGYTTTFRLIHDDGGMESRSSDPADGLAIELRNCGTGDGGFHAGNRCGGGGGGGSKGGGAGPIPGLIGHDAGRAALKSDAAEFQEYHKMDAPPSASYEHGPPASLADRKHLDRAAASGRVAVVVADTPHRAVADDASVEAHLRPGHPPVPKGQADAQHHVVSGDLAATTRRDGDKHAVDEYSGYPKFGVVETYRFKTRENADRKAASIADRAAKADANPVRRTTARDVGSFDYGAHLDARFGHTTTFRVIHD